MAKTPTKTFPRRHYRDSDPDSRIALAELSTRLDSMDADYTDLRSAVVGLGSRIDALGSSINAKIDERARPQWQTYIAGAMLLGGLFFAFIEPIQRTQIERGVQIANLGIEHKLFVKDVGDTLERRNNLFVGQAEHREYRARVDDAINGLRRDMVRIETGIERSEKR